MTEFKKNIILDVSKEIADHINEKYGLEDPDLYTDVAWFINQNFSYLFGTIEEMIEEKV
jgi:hypothetical protein